MTHPIYTAQALEALTPAAVKTIAKSVGIAQPAHRKATGIQQILSHQAATIIPATPTATCATCPFFTSHGDGSNRGWCNQFDKFARESHERTQDCDNQAECEPTEAEASQIWHTFTCAAQVGDIFSIPGSPEVIVIDRRYSTPTELLFSVAFIQSGNVMTWVMPMDEADESIEQEWYTAKEELSELLEQKAEAIAPEPVVKAAENVYQVLSSNGAHRYRVDLWKRTCSCPAGAHRNPCKHIPMAESKQRQEVSAEMSAKGPAGWRQKADGWFHNSLGHRTNVMPV